MKKPIKSMPIIVICLIIILIGYTIYTVWSTSKYVGAKKEFNKNFEAYEHIREFTINEMKETKENESLNVTIALTRNFKWYYYFSNQEGEKISDSYDIPDKSVLDNLELLRKIDGTSFDLCRGWWFEKYAIIDFVYDWECAYDERYTIYWCEDLNVLKLYLQGCGKYKLKKLKDNWYYVGWDVDSIFDFPH